MNGKTNLKAALIISVFLLAMGPAVASGGTIYVDADASTGGDGQTWGTAYKYLQDALYKPPTSGDEIWVAEGMYKPDANTANPTGTGDRTATFQLINDVPLYGGFGSGGGDWSERDPIAYETILSGDLAGDDVGFTNNDENSYHVVTGSGTETNTILDGFTITAGNANASGIPNDAGGGMRNESGNPTVRNCTFTGNSAIWGGGIENFDASPVIANCTFSENFADNGGGVNNYNSNMLLTNCTFYGNSASRGGGMYNRGSISPILTNCSFSGNSASYEGGGMYNRGSSGPILTNCSFSGNSAGGKSGGMYNYNSSPTLTNCILWGNSDSGGMFESAQILGGTLVINYCCVQGWTGSLGGTGNIGDDPMFKDADGPDNIIGNADDNLRLSSLSPCIDGGDNFALPADVTTDLGGAPRIAGWIVDMGAYEWDSPVAHWRLDEGSGTTARDSSGSGHDGTLYGDPNWKPAGGQIAGALQLDGLDDYVDCGNDSSFDITEEITLSVWVKTNDSGNNDWNPYVTKGDGPYGLKHRSTNQIEFAVYTGTWQVAFFDVDSSFNGVWHHLAATYDGSKVRLYLDGTLEAASAGTGSIATNTYNLNIGRCSQIPDWLYSGLIDDVRIYNYALNGDEVRWLLCARPPRGDVNRDCRFDFVDFAILVSEWLDCGLMIPELCGQ